MQRLLYLLKGLLKRDPDQAAAIGTVRFGKAKPIKPARGATALNKTGRLVLYGEHGGQAEKIYEAANAEHARFIGAVSAHAHLTDCFPPVRALQGRFLIVGWASNFASRAVSASDLALLISRIHATPLTGLPSAGFDYWHDLIRPRFVRAAELLGITDSTSDITARVDAAWDNSSKCLMHPDITPANLVRTADNHWQVVDNELLTVGALPIFDLCNAAYALGSEAGQELVRLYLGDQKRRLSDVEISVLNDFWFARRLGSEFVAGKIAAAGDLLVRYRMKQDILPTKFQS